MSGLRGRLKAVTAAHHARLDSLPFFQALRAGTLGKPSIVVFLRCLALIHLELERAASLVRHPGIARLVKAAPPKRSFILADLAAAQAESVENLAGPIKAALDYCAGITSEPVDEVSLAGPLYVLEGSQNGGMILKHAYARCLGLPAERIGYFGCYGDQTAAQWRRFCAALNGLSLEDGELARIDRAALRCFAAIEAIARTVHPYIAGEANPIAAVNAEAGFHAMPQDPLDIDLALRAGRAAWQAFPYLAVRYGERGERFTASDSCWLVTLTHQPAAHVTQQLNWLRHMLSGRGIPTIILESHLRLIQQMIGADFAEGGAMRKAFDPFLADMTMERRALGQGHADLVAMFENRLRACAGFTVEPAAAIIASAWADHRAGIPRARDCVIGWFTDPLRFSRDWIDLVTRFVAALDGSPVN